MNVMKYNGFIGTVAYSEEDDVFFGKIEGINSLVNFEGRPEKGFPRSSRRLFGLLRRARIETGEILYWRSECPPFPGNTPPYCPFGPVFRQNH